MDPVLYFRPLIAVALLCAGCTASPPRVADPQAPRGESAPVRSASEQFEERPLRAFEYEDAIQLSGASVFEPLGKVVAERLKPGRDLAYIGTELLDSRNEVVASASKTFRPLPHHLEYVSHVVLPSPGFDGLVENFVSLYGISEVVSWNSRKVEAGLLPSNKPDQVVLVEGRFFPPSDRFVFDQSFAEGGKVQMACKVVAEGAASSIHPALAGRTRTFECMADGSPAMARYWFLEETQRYVVQEILYQGQLQSRFRITAVAYRQ